MALVKTSPSRAKNTSRSINISSSHEEIGSVIYIVPQGRVFSGEIFIYVAPDAEETFFPFINGVNIYKSSTASSEVVRLSEGDQIAVGNVNSDFKVVGDEYAV